MINSGDAVGSGFVASLAPPGGNITGLSTLRPELSGKRLELLQEIVPRLSRVAVFVSSASQDYAQVLKEFDLAAGPLGVKLQYLDILSPRMLRPHSEPQLRGGLTRSFSGCRASTSVLSDHRLQNSRYRAGSRRYMKGQKK